MSKKIGLYLYLATFLSIPTLAEQTSCWDEPLKKTQEVMRDSQKRNAIIKEDPKAFKAEEIARQVMGENTDEIHDLSAEILEVIYKQAEGDALKMQDIVIKASRNPAAFLESLPEEYKSKVQSLAKKSPLNKTHNP